MSTLLFNFNKAAVPADEAEVRATTNVVNNDAPSAVSDHSPGFNELETDPDTEGGLTTRQVASHVVPTERYVNPTLGEANAEHNAIIDRQVSTSGTAAAREASGEWGHGTMMVTEGIEPTVRPDAAFGDLYFKADEEDIQNGMGNYMTPAVAADPQTLQESAAAGNRNARQAASPYSAYLQG